MQCGASFEAALLYPMLKVIRRIRELNLNCGFRSVSKALSDRVQDKSETAILKEALGTVGTFWGMELVHRASGGTV
jgi:hypothetical protein